MTVGGSVGIGLAWQLQQCSRSALRLVLFRMVVTAVLPLRISTITGAQPGPVCAALLIPVARGLGEHDGLLLHGQSRLRGDETAGRLLDNLPKQNAAVHASKRRRHT